MPGFTLSDIEARVLGSLIEKEFTTSAYYPLTLNSLTAACNQKQNREPVVSLSEDDVVRALDRLRELNLATKVHKADSRVPKYEQLLRHLLDISHRETAVLAELMLRGPQTAGEVRGRAERMQPMGSMEETESLLVAMVEAGLVVKLPRQSGQKEQRYAHLLSGALEVPEARHPDEPAARRAHATDEKIAAHEAELAMMNAELASVKAELASVRAELEDIRRVFGEFRSQF